MEKQLYTNKITYQPWYEYVGRHMTIPEDGTWIEAYPLQEIPTKPPREQIHFNMPHQKPFADGQNKSSTQKNHSHPANPN
jgi:hypothetical protein